MSMLGLNLSSWLGIFDSDILSFQEICLTAYTDDLHEWLYPQTSIILTMFYDIY